MRRNFIQLLTFTLCDVWTHYKGLGHQEETLTEELMNCMSYALLSVNTINREFTGVTLCSTR
jgi:hypothetical protein